MNKPTTPDELKQELLDTSDPKDLIGDANHYYVYYATLYTAYTEQAEQLANAKLLIDEAKEFIEGYDSAVRGSNKAKEWLRKVEEYNK